MEESGTTFCEADSSSVNFKRAKIDSKQAEESAAKKRESEQEDSVFAIAFETDLVREGIFKYLSTSELLSTCSLVSKNWNTKARSFIYTHRQCTPIMSRDVSVCEFFENIGQLCLQMIAQGRLVPFNRLHLCSYKKCPQDSIEKKIDANLEGVLVVKHLKAFIDTNQSDCSVHRPLCTLLSQIRRSELRSLTVRNFLLFAKIMNQSGWGSPFIKLREFTIVGDHYNSEKDLPAVKATVARLLKMAPNLVAITVSNSPALQQVPEEKYGLLRGLEFQLNNAEDMDMLRKIAKQSCRVEQLFIHEPPAYTEYADGEFELEFDDNTRSQFENAVRQLLQSCKNSLRSISVNGGYSLAQLSQAPLKKLAKLKMEKPYHATTRKFWDAVASVDYARVAPQLQDMEILMNTWKWTWNEMYEPGIEAEREWPENSNNTVTHRCSSVKKLTLELLVAKINMPLLNSFLPNVSELELRISHTASIESEIELPDISQMFQLWPGLKELTIIGEDNCLQRCYDADFCGIHPEEVELLMEMDEDYLQAVNLVPIRPCIRTMTDLRKLQIDLKFCRTAEAGDPGRPVAFITKVTEIIALKRMANKDFSVSWDL